MPGFLVNTDATVTCDHTGAAQPQTSSQRVNVSGKPVITKLHTYSISSCIRTPADGGPCKTAQWTHAATRVRVSGKPVVLKDSQAECLPPKGTLLITVTQERVKGI